MQERNVVEGGSPRGAHAGIAELFVINPNLVVPARNFVIEQKIGHGLGAFRWRFARIPEHFADRPSRTPLREIQKQRRRTAGICRQVRYGRGGCFAGVRALFKFPKSRRNTIGEGRRTSQLGVEFGPHYASPAEPILIA